MFSRLFHRRKTTIYEDYIAYTRFNIWNTTENDIQFITGRLIKSGLEDVSTLDNKWHEYIQLNEVVYNNANYLEFILKLVTEYHKNCDRFTINGDIENI